jgi:thiazole biosynthesis/tRNA modification protein ThiI
MKPTQIMIRYGELSTKGKNINYFIDMLGRNVKNALEGSYPKVDVSWFRDRMYVELNGESSDGVVERLQDIFGIQTISPVIQVEKTLEAAEEGAIEIVRPFVGEAKSFKINTKRADHNFEYDTMELNRALGSAVATTFPELDVKMESPDLTVRTEVRADGIYLSVETIQASGGLPVGTAGKGMLMLSGGIDSPVAGYLSMKRGIDVEAVHFASPPYTSPQALQKAKDLTAKLARFNGQVTFIEVPFTQIQEQIKKDIPEGYIMTVTRRMMLRLTDLIREQRGGLAIMNGESLGQVASQTLESMLAINEVTTTPILRPLVAMDKTEIVEIAQDIDTYELSILPYEDCCTIFTPPRPKTKPSLERVIEYEKALDVEGLLERAMAGLKIEKIGPESTNEAVEEGIFEGLL